MPFGGSRCLDTQCLTAAFLSFLKNGWSSDLARHDCGAEMVWYRLLLTPCAVGKQVHNHVGYTRIQS